MAKQKHEFGLAEARVWHRAWEAYGNALSDILDEALCSYKRIGGFDEMTRLHSSAAGADVLVLLRQAMVNRWPGTAADPESYVAIRFRLRAHIVDFLLYKLVIDQHETPALREAYFAADLGL